MGLCGNRGWELRVVSWEEEEVGSCKLSVGGDGVGNWGLNIENFIVFFSYHLRYAVTIHF